jgi:hypothetical protein
MMKSGSRVQGTVVRSAIAASLIAVGALGMAHMALAAKPDAGTKRYLIQHSHANAAALKSLIARTGGKVVFSYASIDGLAADLSPAQLRSVRSGGLATSIQEDEVRKLHSRGGWRHNGEPSRGRDGL